MLEQFRNVAQYLLQPWNELWPSRSYAIGLWEHGCISIYFRHERKFKDRRYSLMNKNTQNDKKTSTELIWQYVRTSVPSFKPTSICKASGWRMTWCKITLWPASLVGTVYEHRSFFLYPAEVQNCKVQLHSCRGERGFSPCSRASFLRAEYWITQVSMRSPLQELTSWFKKKKPMPLRWGKPL